MTELQDHGMTVQVPAPEVLTLMREATANMADAFTSQVPAAGPILEEFRATVAE